MTIGWRDLARMLWALLGLLHPATQTNTLQKLQINGYGTVSFSHLGDCGERQK